MAYSGRFSPKNPRKYMGDPSNIIWRSRWELVCMMKFDSHPDVISWGSEELTIMYKSPIDGRIHRYFPDFLIKIRNKDDQTETILIEVKPHKQTMPPTIQEGRNTKPNKRYLNEVATWGVNSAKWKAAREYCSDRKWKFMIITEKELNLNF